MLTTVDVRELHDRCTAAFAARVHAVDGRWAAATPLPGWNVRELVAHLVAEQRWTPPLLAGASTEEIGDRFEGDLLGADPVAAFDEAVAGARTAVHDEGAMVGTVHLSFGDRPGREYAMQLAADHLVHTWDLARSIGADESLDADAVAAVAEWFDTTETEYRAAGVIGPRIEVPATAGPQARLLGRFGRRS